MDSTRPSRDVEPAVGAFADRSFPAYASRTAPDHDEVERYLTEGRNWGRWGDDDQLGTVNLITPAKRLEAASLVRSGISLSLSRDYPVARSPVNEQPALLFTLTKDREGGYGSASDFQAGHCHGYGTHIDSLGHIWGPDGMWGGRSPASEVTTRDGLKWGDVYKWRNGIVTRGVLLDVPRHRGVPYVTLDAPVHGWELEDVTAAEGVSVTPGDALLVYSGYEEWESARAADAARQITEGKQLQPGLHASCLKFIREADVAILAWDMLDANRQKDWVGARLRSPWGVHNAIHAFGLAVVDHAALGTLAKICREQQRYEFMFVVSPIPVVGGTGCLVNPLAIM